MLQVGKVIVVNICFQFTKICFEPGTGQIRTNKKIARGSPRSKQQGNIWGGGSCIQLCSGFTQNLQFGSVKGEGKPVCI